MQDVRGEPRDDAAPPPEAMSGTVVRSLGRQFEQIGRVDFHDEYIWAAGRDFAAVTSSLKSEPEPFPDPRLAARTPD
jgi:hypothetical protein